MTDRVIIIGGGISGLSTAFYLKEAGIKCTIIEKSGRLGGLIKTDHTNGCDLEAGPDSFIATKPAAIQLARQLGIEDQVIGTNDRSRRVFVVKNGKLIPLPAGMVMMVPGNWWTAARSPLISLRTKLRFLRETHFAPRDRSTDFSICDFVLDHFGQEALEYITEPLLSGVYGGDASALSARSVLPKFVDYERRFGSLIKGVRQERVAPKPAKSLFLSFKGGMSTMVEALSKSLTGHAELVKGEVKGLVHRDGQWESSTEFEHRSAECVVLACPAHISATLLSMAAPSLSAELASIPYSSAILSTLLYKKEDFDHPLDGFGFLVPQRERYLIAAATWINTKFPSRVSDWVVAIRTFIVDPEARFRQSTPPEELTRLVATDIRRLMNVTSNPIGATVASWPDSMPQYTVGHQARVDRISGLEEKCPGLYLSSNYFDGVGIPDCIRCAEQTAQKIAAKLAPK